MSHFYQFELWKECNNNCTFCFNRNRSKLSDGLKYKRIMDALQNLRNIQLNDDDTVGFIGGEFFDGQLDYPDVCFSFFNMVSTVLLETKARVFIATSFIYQDLRRLKQFLDLLPGGALDRLLLCTSYDVDGRFKTRYAVELWEHNIAEIHRCFPEVGIHTEMILSQPLIDAVLASTLDIKTFAMPVSFHAPCCGIGYKDKYAFTKDVPNFFPTRNSFLKFLNKGFEEGWLTPDNCINYDRMSDNLWMDTGSGIKRIVGKRGPIDGKTIDPSYPLPPMHESMSDYIDSHIRMRWDVLNSWENFNA